MYSEKQLEMLKKKAAEVKDFTMADTVNFISAYQKCEAGTEDKLTEDEAILIKSLVSCVPATYSKEQGEVIVHAEAVKSAIANNAEIPAIEVTMNP